jgi:NitT/TauT family transport system substrate-binding protein
MTRFTLTRCLFFCSLISLCILSLTTQAADKVTFVTSWFAEAEHGGFYQAIAEGTYKKYGLDVSIKMGGPQVNAYQLLLAGQADFAMGYDIQTLKAVEQGLPLVSVAAVFQRDPAVLIAHPDVKTLADLKTRTLLIGQTSETTFWPWLKKKYGFTNEQKRPYAFSVQPFLIDKNLAQQGLATSEPYAIEKAGVQPRVFLLADAGYPPYAETIVAVDKTLKQKPDVVRRFVQATAEGWKSYLKNPAPGNALIQKDNPQIEPALLTYGVTKMREYQLVSGGDTQSKGLLVMTDMRWQQTRDFLVQSGLLRADVDVRKAYTLDFLPATKVLPK